MLEYLVLLLDLSAPVYQALVWARSYQEAYPGERFFLFRKWIQSVCQVDKSQFRRLDRDQNIVDFLEVASFPSCNRRWMIQFDFEQFRPWNPTWGIFLYFHNSSEHRVFRWLPRWEGYDKFVSSTRNIVNVGSDGEIQIVQIAGSVFRPEERLTQGEFFSLLYEFIVQ